ncbi:MAG: TetR/AcrR family transcriptional regulator [Alphaproteobacteria bacterium]|nr:TetR/AcrR family transcriptional regulator [Alphaproteobacteria bacterium]
METKDYTKLYITTALFKLMETRQFSEINIKEIVEKAGVARISFYRKFKSKEDIIYQYISEHANIFSSKIEFRPRCENDYYEIIYRAFEGAKAQRKIFDLLIHSNLEHIIYDFINKGFIEAVKNHRQPNDYYAYGYAGAFSNILISWVKNDYQESTEDIAKTMFGIVFPGDRDIS